MAERRLSRTLSGHAPRPHGDAGYASGCPSRSKGQPRTLGEPDRRRCHPWSGLAQSRTLREPLPPTGHQPAESAQPRARPAGKRRWCHRSRVYPRTRGKPFPCSTHRARDPILLLTLHRNQPTPASTSAAGPAGRSSYNWPRPSSRPCAPTRSHTQPNPLPTAPLPNP